MLGKLAGFDDKFLNEKHETSQGSTPQVQEEAKIQSWGENVKRPQDIHSLNSQCGSLFSPKEQKECFPLYQ